MHATQAHIETTALSLDDLELAKVLDDAYSSMEINVTGTYNFSSHQTCIRFSKSFTSPIQHSRHCLVHATARLC